MRENLAAETNTLVLKIKVLTTHFLSPLPSRIYTPTRTPSSELKLNKVKAAAGPISGSSGAPSKLKIFKKDLAPAAVPAPFIAPPAPVSQLQSDLEGLNLVSSASDRAAGANGEDEDYVMPLPPTPVISLAKEKILALVREREALDKPVLSLVVVGRSFLVCDQN